MKRNIPWDLIIQKLKNDITDNDNDRLMIWISENENKEVFDEISKIWQSIQLESLAYTPNINDCWQKISLRIETSQKNKLKQEKTHLFKFIPNIRFKYYVAASLFAAILVSSSIFLSKSFSKSEVMAQSYSTLGGKSKLILPDGTEVWLHSNTTLSYSTDYKLKDRVVNLKGEAYFEVRHDIKKPFIVQLDGLNVVVHGTKFEVESFPNSEHISVSLLEGAVSLETTNEKKCLYPGETALYDKKNKMLTVSKGDVEFSKSWANNKIEFKNKSLGSICRFLSRWYSVKIDVDPCLSHKQFYTFTLQNEPLEEVLRIMSRINSISYRFNDSNVLIITKKK